MFTNFNADFHTVLVCATDGEILKLPVRVRNVTNARTWSKTLFYTPAEGNIESY